METTVRYAHPIFLRTTNPCPNASLRFRYFPVIAHLNFNRFPASIGSRFQLSKLFFNSQHHMATQSNLSPQSTADKLNSKQIEEKEEKKQQPPPLEKPEPGDCCGSGCVRCVWDVYYEELEDYNKLYKSDSKLS